MQKDFYTRLFNTFAAADEDGTDALGFACYHEHLPAIREMLDDPRTDRNSLNVYRMSPLMWAAANGCERAVDMMVADPKTRLDLRDWKNRTAEDCAKDYGHYTLGDKIAVAAARRPGGMS